jgi:hypothetical protein
MIEPDEQTNEEQAEQVYTSLIEVALPEPSRLAETDNLFSISGVGDE